MGGVPEPWGTILQLIIGPLGAIVVLCIVIFFLWRLFREEQKKVADALSTVSTLSSTVKDMTVEVRAWREASRQ